MEAMMSGIVTSTMVARKFHSLADGNDPLLTPLKLMKLVFITQGWHLAFYDRELIYENVEAWPNGPVFPDLYDVVNKYGDGLVEKVSKSPNEKYFSEKGLLGEIHNGAITIIEYVSEQYNDWTGEKLSALTHMKKSPWHDTCVEFGGTDMAPIIQHSLIKKYYKKFDEVDS